MKIHSLLALSLSALTAACAAAGVPGAVAPTASMPQVQCSVQPMTATPHANRAQAALNRTEIAGENAREALYREALTHARAGLEEDDRNPYHHLLAGMSAAALGEVPVAERHLSEAMALCPELRVEYVEPTRRAGWIVAFGQGLAAYEAGDTARAIQAWEQAAGFWDGLANANFNLAILAAQRGNQEEALRHYRQVLRILGESEEYEVEPVRTEGLEARSNTIAGMIAVGVHFFQQERFEQAAEVFREILAVEPRNRDANYNLALSLLRLERWGELEAPARRAVEADPLNFNARVVLFNSFRGRADAATGQQERELRNQALRVLEEAEALPVRMAEISVNTVEGTGVVMGQLLGTPHRGGPLTLDFTLFGASGEVGRGSTTVERPAAGQPAAFRLEVPVEEPVTGWSYTVR